MAFVLKCMFASGFFMFISMATGEIFVDPNLFSGFLQRPSGWPHLFLESAIATLPISLIGLFVLTRIRTVRTRTYIAASLGVWTLLGSVIVVVYKTFYWPREWQLTALEPGLIFGWIIPCILILGSFLLFSMSLHKSQSAVF